MNLKSAKSRYKQIILESLCVTKKYVNTTICILALFSLTTQAHASTAEDFQTWGNITALGSLSPINPKLDNFKYWLEAQGRFGLNSSAFSQAILRVGLGYKLSNQTSIWLGYAFVPTDEPFTKKAFDEHRMWQQLLWSNNYSFGTISSRSRLEQRFMPTGSQVGWRFRQLLKISVPIALAQDFSVIVSDEYFVNLNKTNYGADDGFDQNRAFAGIGYNLTKNIKTEIGYMNQYIRKANGADRMDNIFSTNLYFNF